jgi:hypothetical protein
VLELGCGAGLGRGKEEMMRRLRTRVFSLSSAGVDLWEVGFHISLERSRNAGDAHAMRALLAARDGSLAGLSHRLYSWTR